MVESTYAQSGVRRFTLELVLAAIVFTTVTFGALYFRSRALMYESLRDQAANHFDLIVTARAWNANHNGVWVVMREGVEPNRYLQELGIDPVTETADGVGLTLRNPAIMASEISELLESKNGITYHLVGLNPINPANEPDGWERESLLAFDESVEPRWTMGTNEHGEVFRYMRPLLVERSCVECHVKQGYQVGQIAGATTIEIPTSSLADRLLDNAITIAVLGTLSMGAAVSSIILMTSRLGARVRNANERLINVARTDELTGLLNRRGALQRLSEEIARADRNNTPLAVAMLDLDHFKRVNDQHGHYTGDEVLRHFARLLLSESRSYDILGRLGGEEFLLIAPATTVDEALALAQRVRVRVGAEHAVVDGTIVPTTVSIGVVELRPTEDADALLSRVDTAMYAAKEAGRDRVAAD